LKRILLAAAALAALALPVSIANADVSQEFSFQLKNVRPDGRFTVVFTSRTFDTSGGIPPPLRESYIRLPAGAKIPSAFLKKKYYCDVSRLLKDLQANPKPGTIFYNRVANLKPFIKSLKKSHAAADRKALKNAEICDSVHIGKGTAQVDARPLLEDLIPSKFVMFFGKGTQSGAVASIQILGMPDETSAVVKKLPVTVQQTRVPFVLNFINDPTPDGKYGYKLQFPTGPIAGVNISISEVNAVTTGLTLKKKKTTCKKRRHGRCVKRKVKKTNLFWFTRPTCPASGNLSFQAFYGYDDPQPDITKTIELSCPKFSA
jgi:hypothetical protein